MIKLPSDEFKKEMIKKSMTNYHDLGELMVISDILDQYNAEILRINEPAKPEFPEWVKYITFDKNDGWWLWTVKPEYTHIGWYTDDRHFEYQPDFTLTSKEILWLEYINNGRPPEQSLICLADYRKDVQ